LQEKTKVLIVGMSSQKGGIEQFVIQFIRNANRDEFAFDFLTFAPVCAYEEELISYGCVINHATRRGTNPIKSYTDQAEFFKKRGSAYDIVWLHLSSASDLSTILLAKKYTDAKIACHSHGTNFESREGLIRKIHGFLHKKNQKRLRENTDIFLACSSEAGKWLYGEIGKDLIVVPNGINTDEYKFDSTKRAEIRKKLNIDDKQIVLGHVGRLVEVKNHGFLLDIFFEFQKQANSIMLLIGEGELENELENKCEDMGILSKVRFLGFRDDVADLLQAFDVFLLPSFSEGFPITLVEAQACGLPCLISDTITREVDITGLVRFLSLELSAANWAKEARNSLTNDRGSHDYIEKLTDAGYTDKATAQLLMSIFGGIE